jgi:DNA helicase HerA-like ATPase
MSKTPARALDEVERPASIQQFVRLREVIGDVLCLKHPNAGLLGMHLRSYKAVLQVAALNFGLMSESEREAILAGYRVLINSLRSYGLDIHIRIEPCDLKEYQARLKVTESLASQEEIDAHLDFVSTLASDRALIQRRFYLIVGADDVDPKMARRKAPEELFDAARSQLHLRCEQVSEELARMGLATRRLGKRELGNYYRACWHSAARHYPLSLNQIDAAEHIVRPARDPSARPVIRRRKGKPEETAPPVQQESMPGFVRMAEIVVPSSIQIERSHLLINAYGIDEYTSGITVVGLPAYVDDGYLARLIEIDEPNIDIHVSIHPQRAEAYKAKLRRKLVGYKGTQNFDARRGRGLNHDINVAAEEVEHLLDDLARQTEYVYSQSFHLLIRARSKIELREREQRVFALLTTLELQAVPTAWEHHLALRATLPEGNRLPGNEKILDTSSVVAGFPFTSATLSTETGLLLGLGPGGSLVILDPFHDARLLNANQTLFAKSGAGKSFSIKVSIYRAWLQGVACAVIDPEQEYLPLCQRIRGEYVTLDTTDLRINPFDLFSLSGEWGRNILEEKASEVLPLFDLLLAESGGSLSQTEQALLHRLILQAYSDRGITPDPATHSQRPPHMGSIYALLRYSNDDTTHLADRLERYVALFPTRTSVRFHAQSLFFGIRDLSAELRPVGVFLITSYVWTQMRRSRENIDKWLLCIDEAWSLMEFKQGGNFLASIARRARKYGLGLVTVTQNVEDFLNDPNGRAILSNSSITILMKQAPETINSVVAAFHLSDGERKYLLSAGKGQALLSALGSRVPVQIVASDLEYTFAVSNPAEVREVREAEIYDPADGVAYEETALDEEDSDAVLVPLEEEATAPLSLNIDAASARRRSKAHPARRKS